MLALQKVRPTRGLELRVIDAPGAPDEGEVLVEVTAAGICGSDLHVDAWSRGYEFMQPALPVTIGHEFAGRVIALGPKVAADWLGARITAMPSVACGRCSDCSGGREAACAHRTGIGLTRPGAFASQLRVPVANCMRIADHVSDEMAALTEPFTVGAHAVEVAQLAPGARVLVLGPGTIGQTIAVMAREAGATLVAVAGLEDAARLAVVSQLGFTHAFELAQQSLTAWTRATLGADAGFDVVFEATGVAPSIEEGLDVLRYGGMLVTLGIHREPVAIDLTRLVRRQQQLRGSHRASRSTWEQVLRFLAAHEERLRPMITHHFELADAGQAFELAHSRRASKIMLRPS